MIRLASIALLSLLLLPRGSSAYQWRLGEGTNALVLASDQVLADETLMIAPSLEIAGQARRDLWLLASASARCPGQVDGDLRILSGSAEIDGILRQNLLAYARGLHLTSNSLVRGQVALIGNAIVCEGQVEGDAWIYAQSATLGGNWAGNVRVHAQEIHLVPGTRIAGNLVYASSRALVLDDSVVVAGTVEQQGGRMPGSNGSGPAIVRERFALHGYLFLAALLAGMPFVGFFPLAAGGAVRCLRHSPWKTLAAGTLTLLLGPFLIGFALMTIIGIPLALLAGALYLALAYLAHIVVALWLGHQLLRQQGPQTFARVLSSMTTGLFLLYFATAFSGVASFVALPVVLLGTGALVLSLFRHPVVTVAMPSPPPLPPPPAPPENQE